jgi:hypothetical protein
MRFLLVAFVALFLFPGIAFSADPPGRQHSETDLKVPKPMNSGEEDDWPAWPIEERISAEITRGEVYEYGRDVQQDYAEAMKWYRKAAEHGSAIAEAKIAMMYKYGEGVPQSDTEAEKWIQKSKDTRKAWESAHPDLGGFYFNDGVSFKPAVLPVPAEKLSPGCGKWIEKKETVCLPNYDAFPRELDIPHISLMYGPLLKDVKQIILFVEVPKGYEAIACYPSQLFPDNLVQFVSTAIYESPAMHNMVLDQNGIMPALLAVEGEPKPSEMGPGTLAVAIKVDADIPCGPDPLFKLDRGAVLTIGFYRPDWPDRRGPVCTLSFSKTDDASYAREHQALLSQFIRGIFGEVVRGTP